MLALTLALGWLMAAELPESASGITLEQFLEQNGIDRAEPAFVRVVALELPADCERSFVDAFVEKNWRDWSALQREEFRQDLASSDGISRVELLLQDGKPTKTTLALDSTGSIALMEQLEDEFAAIRFAKACSGMARVDLRFHLPTTSP